MIYTTRYCHLSKINVNEGDTITEGDIIGRIVWINNRNVF